MAFALSAKIFIDFLLLFLFLFVLLAVRMDRLGLKTDVT